MTVTWVRILLFISSSEAWDLALSKLPIKDDCEEVVETWSLKNVVKRYGKRLEFWSPWQMALVLPKMMQISGGWNFGILILNPPPKDWLIVLSHTPSPPVDASITHLDVFQAKKVHEKVIDMVLAQNQVAALAGKLCVFWYLVKFFWTKFPPVKTSPASKVRFTWYLFFVEKTDSQKIIPEAKFVHSKTRPKKKKTNELPRDCWVPTIEIWGLELGKISPSNLRRWKWTAALPRKVLSILAEIYKQEGGMCDVSRFGRLMVTDFRWRKL